MNPSDIRTHNPRIVSVLRSAQRPMPSPGPVALELMRMVERRDVGVFEVCHVARNDPMLVAKCVQLANSALYAGLRPTAAIEEAVMRIGVAALARVAVGLDLVVGGRGWALDFDLARYWRQALARGMVMQQLARRLRIMPTSEAFSLGLLADIGELAMVCAFGTDAAAGDGAREADLRTQRSRWGFDQNQAGAALLDAWSFPQTLWMALLPPGEGGPHAGGRPADLAAMIEVARSVGSALGSSAGGPHGVPALYLGAARLGLDADAVAEMVDALRADFGAMARMLDVPQGEQIETEFTHLRDVLIGTQPHEDPDAGAVLLLAGAGAADEPAYRALVEAGLRVAATEEPARAREMLGLLRADALVVDADLPGVDAIALCRELREAFGAALYIVLVGSNDVADALLQGLGAGANDMLGKPLDGKVLGAKLRLGGRTVRLIRALEAERESALGMQRELARLNADLRTAAYSDELTGLPNRRAFEEFVHKAWADAQRNNRALSCVVLDLDHFKQVNDSYGHEVGDRVLRAVTQALQGQIRAGDILARWGGEELVLVCPGTDQAAALVLAERMRAAVEALNGDTPPVTLSAGVAQAGADGVADMLRNADAALLRAKREGRNRVVAAA